MLYRPVLCLVHTSRYIIEEGCHWIFSLLPHEIFCWVLQLFCFYTFCFSNISSSSSVNCSSFMSSWLLIIFYRFIIDFRRRSSRILKWSFHFWRLSSWLVASILLSMWFSILLTAFTRRHDNSDCLSSTKYLILIIWLKMYSSRSFWQMLILAEFS